MIGGGGRFRRGPRQFPKPVDHLGRVQGENRVTDEPAVVARQGRNSNLLRHIVIFAVVGEGPAHIAEYCGTNRSLLMEPWQRAHDPIELPREDVKQST
jgi:hypothetical protein